MISYPLVLITTILIEFVVLLLFFKDFKKVLLYSILINSLTNPLANLFYQNFGINVILIEVCVFLAEGFLIMLLFRTKWEKAFLVSFVANLVSFLIGLILF